VNNYQAESEKDYKFDETLGVFYSNQEDLDLIRSFDLYQCPECHEKFSSAKQFKNHAFNHGLKPCPTCFKSDRFLKCDIQVYTQKNLNSHRKGHPKCPCCKYEAFDNRDLSEHMMNNHFRCDICASQNKILWFDNIELIQVHFHQEHYACTHPICVSHGFIVFETLAELQLHQIQVHDMKIDIDIQSSKNVEEETQHELEKLSTQRRHDARVRLTSKAKSILNNQNRVDSLFVALDKINRRRISPDDFHKEYRRICGKLNSEILFCDLVASISDTRARSVIIRLQEGLRFAKPAPATIKPIQADFPSLTPQVPEKDEPKKPKKPSPWDRIKIK